jgi:meiotically up-regulated gene 157 (Mug157) protein
MHDANSPSLLVLPYLGFIDVNEPIYANTRKFVLSKQNPYFYKGSKGEGIGGPHVSQNYIWPVSIIMGGLTSTTKIEVEQCLHMDSDNTADTYFMHESYHKDNDNVYTRSWFA